MLGNLFNIPGQETEEHWVSISDVMAGLMVIFLFIAISYMVNVNKNTDQIRAQNDRIRAMRDNIKQLLNAYTNLQADLSEELKAEFEGTPTKKQQFHRIWQGHLDMATLSIRFKKPFAQGDATVPQAFKDVLSDFFPRYIAILTKSEYRNEIAEIRIEGHTSSEWFDRITGNEAYIKNMELSQNRARNVLYYVLRIEHSTVVLNRAWLRKNLTANGLSSSQLILNLNMTSARPANPYSIVQQETDIPLWKIGRLHQRIRSWPRSKRISRKDIFTNLSLDLSEFEHNTVAMERAVDLLMENRGESRRVEFRVVTKSEKLINEIKQLMEAFDK